MLLLLAVASRSGLIESGQPVGGWLLPPAGDCRNFAEKEKAVKKEFSTASFVVQCVVQTSSIYIFRNFDPAWSGNLNGQPQYITAARVAMSVAMVKSASSSVRKHSPFRGIPRDIEALTFISSAAWIYAPLHPAADSSPFKKIFDQS